MADTRTIRGWRIEATCPRCGHPLEHVADGQPNGVTSKAIAHCTNRGCGRTYVVQITIADAQLGYRRAAHREGCPCAGCGPGRHNQPARAA